MRKHILISGIVQGVGFRYSVYKRAQQLGVKGWIKNTATGKVEAIIEGSPKAIEELLTFCKTGPLSAHVTSCIIKDEKNTEKFEQFEIRD